MGNRAVIDMDGKTGIYLHWNGGPESVASFLQVAKDYGLRPSDDDNYGTARFVQIIANYFGGDLSIGVADLESLEDMQDGDQKYVIENWEMKCNHDDCCASNIHKVVYSREMVEEIHEANDGIFLKWQNRK